MTTRIPKLAFAQKTLARLRTPLLLAGTALAVIALASHDAPAIAAASVDTATSSGDWPMFGQNLNNTASARGPSPLNIHRLQLEWTFTTGGDVSARAAVVGGRAYFPDWGGNLWAVDTATGTKVWGHQLSDYGLPANTHSRTSPAVDNGIVYVGTQEGAWLLAIDAASGDLLWKVQLESVDTYAMITASPAVANHMVYTGVASNQEGAAASVEGFVCCTARGSVVAVNVDGTRKGQIAWKTYTIPPGYSGGAVWGSNFAIDTDRRMVYASTGNNYAHPTDPTYVACVAGGGTSAGCMSPDNHVDSILALDMRTGRIKWAHKFVTWLQSGIADGSDDWNVACIAGGGPNCPTDSGPDYDFASAPNLITYDGLLGRKKTILGAGQKSGLYYALDPDSGAELWHTQVGPGSTLGGMEWGSASDGKRIYVSVTNFLGLPSAAGSAGSWAALDPKTGQVLWQVADPNGSIALGPVTVASGIVYAPSMAGDASAPTMLGLNAETGQTLWSYVAGASVNAGATVADGAVYWGSGYAHLGIPGFTGNNKFYAFSTH